MATVQLTIIRENPIRKYIHSCFECMLDLYTDMLENSTNNALVSLKYSYFCSERDRLLDCYQWAMNEIDMIELCILWQLASIVYSGNVLKFPHSSLFYTRK